MRGKKGERRVERLRVLLLNKNFFIVSLLFNFLSSDDTTYVTFERSPSLSLSLDKLSNSLTTHYNHNPSAWFSQSIKIASPALPPPLRSSLSPSNLILLLSALLMLPSALSLFTPPLSPPPAAGASAAAAGGAV